jgi:hypothetical protein
MPGVTRYIYVMQRVRKAHQDKLILDDVTLAWPEEMDRLLEPGGLVQGQLRRLPPGHLPQVPLQATFALSSDAA